MLMDEWGRFYPSRSTRASEEIWLVRKTAFPGERSTARRGGMLGACPTLTVLLRRTIRDHLRRARPEKIPTYSSEYASGFSEPAASHLATAPSPRHDRQCRADS